MLMKLSARDSRPPQAGRAAKLGGTLHSRERDRRAVRYHYDVSNEFYQLFLGTKMIYSEAYFGSPEDDLGSAETQQLERICRALRLQKGERLLDIGCGWGGLMIYAAQNFGVETLGVTLSERQAELAGQRIREAGLAERCRVEIRDYRDLDEQESFDKIASVGMVEHVGAAQQPDYFARAWKYLRPGGAFFLSGISRLFSVPAKRSDSFIEAYVFPDGELAPIHETLRAAEKAGFEVRSCEGMREHYGLTLRHWVRRLESHAEEARRLTDEATYRVWRIYMAGSAARFMAGAQNVHQTLLVKLGKGAKSPYSLL
jgi:cyclopropane-fatty-acyl-phospholipid synthase